MRYILTCCPYLCAAVQGQCGASYAFSAIGALEGAWALAHSKLTLLSEQNIIDCSGKHGCFTNIHSIVNILQCHMETMAVRVETCTMPSSTSLPTRE